MTLGRGVLVRGLLFAAAMGLAWGGVGLFVYGLYLVLIPALGAAGAAFTAALICLAAGALLFTLMIMKAPQLDPAPIPAETQVVQGGTLIKLLSELAQDHPLMAVCCAAVLGATNGADNARRR